MEIRRFPRNARYADMLRIGLQYEAAIVRRGREATDPEWLAGLWRDVGACFVRKGKNFLLLRKLGPVYVASHFAPETLRGGYRLLKAVAESGLPICFAVPDDLAVDLERLGWKRLPGWANGLLRSKGMPVEKTVLVPVGLLKLVWQLMRSKDWYTELDSGMEPAQVVKVVRYRKKKRRVAVWRVKKAAVYKPFAQLNLVLRGVVQ